MKRRGLLAGTGVLIGGLTAGCNSLEPSNEEDSQNEDVEYSYGLYNYSEEEQSFSITVLNTHQEEIHTEEIRVGAEKALEVDSDDEITFSEHPVRIHVRVDSKERNVPWPASASQPGIIATSIEISYSRAGEGEITVSGG